MELRTILYGYEKRQFEYFINEGEAAIVRRIFKEYLAGKTLLQIGKELTAEGAVYYRGRSNWSKQAIRRIIENKRYTGDQEYPSIIDSVTYEKANALRLEKGGDREKDTPEIHYLKYHTKCMQCGCRYTRKSRYSKQRERWICSNGCKTPRYLDDETFFENIIDVVNCAILDTEKVISAHNEDKLYNPTIKVQRDEKTLNNIFSQDALNFQSSKKALLNLIEEQFECCTLDRSYAVTDALLAYLDECKPIDKIDVELFKIILSEIQVDENGEIAVCFSNDAVVARAERRECA